MPRGLVAGDWKPKFLQAMRKLPNVSRACVAAGITRITAYERRGIDPEFAQAWDDARVEGIKKLEEEGMRIAMSTERSAATMIIFFLKKLMPEVYGDKWEGELNMKGGLELRHRTDLSGLTDKELEQLGRIIGKLGSSAQPGGDRG